MKTVLRHVGMSALLLALSFVFVSNGLAQTSSKSLVINHGGTACGNDIPEDQFFSGTLTSNPSMINSFNLGLPYYSLMTAYNPADHKVYYAQIGAANTSIYAVDFNFGGNITAPVLTAPTYVYGYQLNQLCFDNNGNNYGFFNFNATAGTAHLAQVDIATGNQVAGSDRLVQFPADNIPNSVGDGDIVILPNGRMFATFGNAPSRLYEFTNLTGPGNITAAFLSNLPRKCFSIAFADGNLVVAGSDAGGCYYYIWDINSFALSTEAPFPLSKNSADMTNLTVAVGATKQLAGVNIINGNTATLYYQIVVKNKGNILVNNLQVTDNLAEVFGAANISNIHVSFSNNASNLTLNPDYNGTTDINLLAASQTLSNYPNAADSIVLNVEVTATNLIDSKVYYNSAIASGNIGSGNNFLAVSDSSNNGNSAKMDLDGNGVSDDAGENVPTPFIFSGSMLPVGGFMLQGTKDNNLVNLSWKNIADATIINYEVERSTDGIHFTTVSTAKSQARPVFADDVSGLNAAQFFYRIKANATNEVAVLSNTIVIKSKASVSVSAYPNPFAGAVTIQLHSDIKVASSLFVRDITGRLLTTKTIALEKGTNYFSITEMATYKPGTYVVEIGSGNDQAFIKLLKQ